MPRAETPTVGTAETLWRVGSDKLAPAGPLPAMVPHPNEPTVAADVEPEIARHLSAGGDELTVRLNPAEMGRIEVRLSFDEGGTLRAVVAAESAAA